MSILWKISKISELLYKMENDINYSTQVMAGDDKEEFIRYVKQVMNNANLLFNKGKAQQLDYDERNKAYEHYDKILDDILSRFPDFAYTNEDSTRSR